MTRQYVVDLSPAQWIQERVHPFAQDIGSLVPDVFESYARVLHPARLAAPDGERDVTWRQIARANRRLFHPQMQFGNVAGTWSAREPHTSNWSSTPSPGTLTITLARALSRVLVAHTSSPRCWFAIWDGWGCVGRPVLPKFELPGRAYFLAEGDVDDVTQTACEGNFWFQSASLWWPDDRAWLVATEVDLDSTYVGGAAAAIDALLTDPALEAVRADIADGITAASDRINPAPTPGHR
ncbi:MAG: hypothetical protein AUH85_12630 [Chloroflexi bacterium 13_1_40CM_4_68_4]|nr:MAG: hypothetical protein AUH85_12630 [Chloroflexi bacterium 13_1_40CM_4_68_4]